MKNKKKVTVIALILAVISALGITAAAAYDSSEDPLISWSYLRDIFRPEILDIVDERFDECLDVIDSKFAEIRLEVLIILEEEIETIKRDLEDLGNNTPPPVQSASSGQYEVVELSAGDAIYAISSCEIILRANDVICIAPDETQGIADLTSGSEIYNGMRLTKNHICLIPRGDGRGILATSNSVFVMVRGEYTIVRE